MSHYHFFEHERLSHEITNIKEDIDTACAKTARMVAEEIMGIMADDFVEPVINLYVSEERKENAWELWRQAKQALKDKYLGGR